MILVEGKGARRTATIWIGPERSAAFFQSYCICARRSQHGEARRSASSRFSGRNQAVSQAFLHAVDFNRRARTCCAVCSLPEDRVALKDCRTANCRGWRASSSASMAELSAWAHLRSGGRQKSSIADELIAFGNRTIGRRR